MQLPYTLRDPFRKSHFSSPEYQSLWPDAKEYLDALQAGAVSGLLDLSIINTFAYEDSLAIGLQAVMGGADPQSELDGVAAAWDELTEKGGRRRTARGLHAVGLQAGGLSGRLSRTSQRGRSSAPPPLSPTFKQTSTLTRVPCA